MNLMRIAMIGILGGLLLTMGTGCMARQADLLAMHKVKAEIQEHERVGVGRIRIYDEQRGVRVCGELYASGLTRRDTVQVFVTLLSPEGDLLAETHSPPLHFTQNSQGTLIPKRGFDIPVHSRASEGSTVQIRVVQN
jgi:hypothetical protein